MRLAGRDLIQAFVREHPDAGPSLRRWAQVMEANNFRHFGEVRKTFPSADYVRPFTVFNIAGNKYRLVALVEYALQAVSIKAILTHEDYGGQTWRAR